MGCFKGGFLMFVDFNRVFKNKPQTQLAVPPAFVDYVNRSLPEGVKYIVDQNGNCVITSTSESCTIGGFTFKPTDEQKRFLVRIILMKMFATIFITYKSLCQ